MTPQEQQMIDGLVERIRSTQVTEKDTAAEQYIQQGLAGYPDATYVMAQTILVQQYGLQQAQSQLQQAQQQVQTLQAQLDELRQHPAPGGGGSFLSHIFGSGSQATPPAQPYPQGQPYPPAGTPGYAQPPYGGQPAYPASYPPPAYAQPYGQPAGYAPAGGGGFLRGALQTAAGVAAGEMAFASIESLFHGFGGGGFGGGDYGERGFTEGRSEEIINNNYYGDSGEHHAESHPDAHTDASLDGKNDGFGNFQNDDRSTKENFAQTDDNGSDPSSFEDSDVNDSGDDSDFGSDDLGSSDDGGGFDSSDQS